VAYAGKHATITGEELLERPAVQFAGTELADRLAGRRILVTGAGGSVGSALADLLASLRPAELVLVESHEPSLFHLRARLLAAQPSVCYRWTLADVRDERKLAAVFGQSRPEIVFHLAAYKHVPLAEENLDQVLAVNVLGTVGLVQQAARSGVEMLVYPSTDKAVNPPSIYGATKRVVERYLAEVAREHFGPAIRLVRLVNVFGTQGSVIETFTRQILAGQPLTITDPRMTRYWMTMAEAAGLLAWTTTTETPGPFILAVGEAAPLEVTARRLSRLLRPDVDPAIRYVGIRPGERLHEELAYPYETLEPCPHPGVRAIRDTRGPGASASDLPHQLGVLAEQLHDLAQPELRRLVFALATGKPDESI
jgi:FlaA1/EpsC-like NDP-sugar epimerase